MRNAFFKELEEVYAQRNNIFLLTGDLGFKLFDRFKSIDPQRFYDIGVAEANMAGIAAGLALTGNIVYCYSIISFLTMRAFEQIRMDIAYQNLNVRLVGFGAGFTYGLEGYSHYGLEDLTLMRSLPNMTIVIPADINEAKSLAKVSSEYKGPMYIRLEKADEGEIRENEPEFKIGQARLVREGKDVALMAIGKMVKTGNEIVDKLSLQGIKATLYNMHTLKPLDAETIQSVALNHEFIFSLEEHFIHGGLGSAIAEILMENGYKGRFKRFGIPEKLKNIIGRADYLRDGYGLTPEKIYNKIMEEIS